MYSFVESAYFIYQFFMSQDELTPEERRERKYLKEQWERGAAMLKEHILKEAGLFNELQTIIERGVDAEGDFHLQENTADELFILLQKMAVKTSPDFAFLVLLERAQEVIERKSLDMVRKYHEENGRGMRVTYDESWAISIGFNAKKQIEHAMALKSFAGFMKMKPQDGEAGAAEIAEGVAADVKNRLS